MARDNAVFVDAYPEIMEEDAVKDQTGRIVKLEEIYMD